MGADFAYQISNIIDTFNMTNLDAIDFLIP